MIQSLQNALKQSPAIRQSVIISIGTVLASAIMAIVLIVAARLLEPELFGVFSVLTAVILIVAKGTDMGLHQLIPRLYQRWQSNQPMQYRFHHWLNQWKIQLSLIVFLMSYPLAIGLESVLRLDMLGLVWVAIIGGIILGLYEYVHAMQAAFHRFSIVSLVTIAPAVFKALSFVILSALFLANNITQTNFLIGFVLFYTLSPAVTLMWWPKLSDGSETTQQPDIPPLHTNKTNTERLFEAIQRYLPHAAIGTWATVLLQNVDIILVHASLNEFETGIYAGAIRIVTAISMLTFAFNTVLMNRVTRYNDPHQLKSYLKKSLSLVLLAAIGSAICAVLARPLIYWTIGPAYLSGVLPFIILVTNGFLGLALIPYVAFFFKMKIPWANSIGGLIQLLPILVINLTLLQTYGIMAAAYARLFATGLFICFTAWLIIRSWSRDFSDVIEGINGSDTKA